MHGELPYVSEPEQREGPFRAQRRAGTPTNRSRASLLGLGLEFAFPIGVVADVSGSRKSHPIIGKESATAVS